MALLIGALALSWSSNEELAGKLTVRSLDRLPNDERKLLELGSKQFNSQDYAAALRAFRKASRLEPGNAATYYPIVLTFDAMGDQRAALEWLRKGLEVAEAHDPGELTELREFEAAMLARWAIQSGERR